MSTEFIDGLSRPLPLELTDDDLAAFDRARLIVFVSGDVMWTLSAGWFARIGNLPASVVLKGLIDGGHLSFLWCDAGEVVLASHVSDDPNALFADYAPALFRDRADNGRARLVHRVFGAA